MVRYKCRCQFAGIFSRADTLTKDRKFALILFASLSLPYEAELSSKNVRVSRCRPTIYYRHLQPFGPVGSPEDFSSLLSGDG